MTPTMAKIRLESCLWVMDVAANVRDWDLYHAALSMYDCIIATCFD
jgi:hypothetical protein